MAVTAVMIKKWEYTYLLMEVQAKKFGEGLDQLIQTLNEAGSEGWEICASSEVTGSNWSGNIIARGNVVFLKRPVIEK
jgi:hypothetical protein